MAVIVAGSLNIDLLVNLERMPNPGETVKGHTFSVYPGGKGLNSAVAAARSGAETSMIGAVGSDIYAEILRSLMLEEKIDDSQVKSVSGASGIALIEVDADSQNRVIVVAGANSEMRSEQFVASNFSKNNQNVVLAQLETPVNELLKIFKLAKSSGFLTILNPSPIVEVPDELYSYVDYLLPNQHEATILSGVEISNEVQAFVAAEKLLVLGVKAVIITLGELGAIFLSAETRIYQPSFPANVHDTTGAGDAFCGVLAAEVQRGSEIKSALKYAAVAGALSTEKSGAAPSIPMRSEILSYLENSKMRGN